LSIPEIDRIADDFSARERSGVLADAAAIRSMSGEVWKDIPGYEGLYQVSNMGEIKSFDRIKSGKDGRKSYILKGRILKPSIDKRYGYLNVDLTKDGVRKVRRLNRLVCFAFIGEPELGQESCHFDNNKLNNKLGNLRWDTRVGNLEDNERHGITNKGSRNGMASLIEAEVVEIKKLLMDGVAQTAIAARVGVSQSTISLINLKKRWAHV